MGDLLTNNLALDSNPDTIQTMFKKILIFVVLPIFLVLSFFFLCCNHVSANNIGVQFDALSGEVKVQPHPGWYITHPFVRVTSLSTVPMVVHVPSNAKVINTKVVRLNPEGVLSFVKIQGFSYDLGRGLDNILMGYAFSGQKFSFLEIVQEGGLENPIK
jgi:hypothetical protein